VASFVHQRQPGRVASAQRLATSGWPSLTWATTRIYVTLGAGCYQN
jgi:hypothetical protein